jgi:hypothetical protein
MKLFSAYCMSCENEYVILLVTNLLLELIPPNASSPRLHLSENVVFLGPVNSRMTLQLPTMILNTSKNIMKLLTMPNKLCRPSPESINRPVPQQHKSKVGLNPCT